MTQYVVRSNKASIPLTCKLKNGHMITVHAKPNRARILELRPDQCDMFAGCLGALVAKGEIVLANSGG